MRKKMAGIILFILLQSGTVLFSQNYLPRISVPISFESFVKSVGTGNLSYISEQFNVSIAEAMLAASKVFPDPELSFAYGNNEDRTLKMGQSVDAGISYPVSLGNKRAANISLARSQLSLSQMVLDAFYQNLRAEAAKEYFAALRDLKIYQMQKENLEKLKSLARADSLRLVNGESSNIDAMQSSLEARAFVGIVFQSLSDMQNSSYELLRLMGIRSDDTLRVPSDEFPVNGKKFELSDLVTGALQKRADLLIAITNKEISEKNLRLLKASRAPELTLSAGYAHNYIANNIISPAPAYNAITAGVGFPIKFSNLNRNPVKTASLAIQQNDILRKNTENQIISEITEMYNKYLSSDKRVNLYKSGIIADAEKILAGRIYSYQHGETGLIEVLNAQRTYIELKQNYINAMFECISALIDLEHAAGIWDINN